MTAGFAPLRPTDGYLPIGDHGLIGDGATAALVGRDGAVVWLCVPRFDASPLFARILDARRGGAFTVAPEGVVEARQRYERDAAVLVTELRTSGGLVEITDALPLRSGADLTENLPAGRYELLRVVRVVEGRVRLHVDIEPGGGAEVRGKGEGIEIRCRNHPRLDLRLLATRPLGGARTAMDLRQGEGIDLALRWYGHGRQAPEESDAVLRTTCEAWRRWVAHVRYEGPHADLVRRSAITLKLLDHFENGAIVAAPTSSLPEAIGGPRNWDYRYAWIRDAAFSVWAFHRIGLSGEARGFLEWVLDAVERHGRPCVLYDLDGEKPAPEREDDELEGYRRSRPVRWGNGAADQRQHDVFGEILDCAYQWTLHHGGIDPALWQRLQGLVESAGREWQEPDHGIWEVRTPGRPFTYSAAMCHVALDRGVRLARRFGLSGSVAAWTAEAQTIERAIVEDAWDERLGSLTEHLGSGGLDASLLTLPLRRVVPARHPRMVATVDAIARRLGAGDGLMYRYLPEESPDGLPGHEGAFLLCSFWLVDNLALQGRVDAAAALFESLCERANPLGLLPEQIDAASGDFLGNYPQAFSHVGLISSAVGLVRATDRARRRA